MNQELVIQDFIIVIAAKNHKPSLLNPDFLRCTGIVPSNWELAREPVNANNVSQVVFTNGITITAEPQRIIFAQPIKSLEIESILIPEIARKYASALPNIEFEAIGINPRGYVPFPNGEDTARQYITQTLLSPGAWQSEGEEPMRASLNLVYKLQRAPFYLTVTEAALRAEAEGETNTPITMFSGSFSYELDGETNAEKLNKLNSVFDNWQSNLEDYKNIISNKFLAQVEQKTLPVGEYNLETNIDSETSNDSEKNNLFAMSV